jgi:hypothetical protein
MRSALAFGQFPERRATWNCDLAAACFFTSPTFERIERHNGGFDARALNERAPAALGWTSAMNATTAMEKHRDLGVSLLSTLSRLLVPAMPERVGESDQRSVSSRR